MAMALLLAYDGTDLHGFQRQAPAAEPTVQGLLEAAVARLAGEPVATVAAGRTDAGVHASGQVVTLRAARPARFGPADWQRALNALLPPAIAVRGAAPVADDVNARFAASARAYRYRILVDAARSPLRERFAWRLPTWPDVAAMRLAATHLLGAHDFAAFGHSPSDTPGQPRRPTVRHLTHAAVTRRDDELWLDFAANAFLTGMVRRMTHALVRVGLGQLVPADVAALLATPDTAPSYLAAPARGLCLTRVDFPPGTITWPASNTTEHEHDHL